MISEVQKFGKKLFAYKNIERDTLHRGAKALDKKDKSSCILYNYDI